VSPPTRLAPRVTAPAGAPSAPLKLDSGALDRLADDVMYRIERRVRIERERRGSRRRWP